MAQSYMNKLREEDVYSYEDGQRKSRSKSKKKYFENDEYSEFAKGEAGLISKYST